MISQMVWRLHRNGKRSLNVSGIKYCDYFLSSCLLWPFRPNVLCHVISFITATFGANGWMAEHSRTKYLEICDRIWVGFKNFFLKKIHFVVLPRNESFYCPEVLLCSNGLTRMDDFILCGRRAGVLGVYPVFYRDECQTLSGVPDYRLPPRVCLSLCQ